MDEPEIMIVVAASRNGVIGREGAMPWRLSSDLKYFRETTMGKPVIMGRKTFQSIGKPLPGRDNIVVSRSRPAIEGVHVAASLDEALALGRRLARESGAGAVAVVGGGEIYRQALPLADEVRLTRVEAEIEGDTVFPALDPDRWTLVSERPTEPGERDSHAMTFAIYRRRRD